MENVLVVGATGTTGNKVVNLLKASQYFEPIAMVRKESQEAAFKAKHIQTVLGDLEEDVSHTVSGIDKVVFAAGSGGKKVEAVDRDGAIKMIDAAQKEGIKKLVMLSSMGAEKPEEADQLVDYLKAKHEADEYLKASSVPHAIVRPGTLTNDKGQGKIELAKALNHSGSISRDDVAQVLTRSLHDDAVVGQSFEIISGDQLIGEAMSSMS